MAVPAAVPFLSTATAYYQWLCSQTFIHIRGSAFAMLRAGPIPQHVAFIMDGNRRYARMKGMKVIQGHINGLVALRRVRRTYVPNLEKNKSQLARFWKYVLA